jgi:predicted DCC family thiol-disulfide oxidoreductase YuxK
MDSTTQIDQPVLLFDGVCNLCIGSVNFIIDQEVLQQYKFASLQSQFAQKILLKNNLPAASLEMNTFYLFADHQVFQKSAAVFSWKWRWIYVFGFLPSGITDYFYDLIAKNRYLWFGRQEKCKIPTPELAQRFLD